MNGKNESQKKWRDRNHRSASRYLHEAGRQLNHYQKDNRSGVGMDSRQAILIAASFGQIG
jgi:hypothetical protein